NVTKLVSGAGFRGGKLLEERLLDVDLREHRGGLTLDGAVTTGPFGSLCRQRFEALGTMARGFELRLRLCEARAQRRVQRVDPHLRGAAGSASNLTFEGAHLSCERLNFGVLVGSAAAGLSQASSELPEASRVVGVARAHGLHSRRPVQRASQLCHTRFEGLDLRKGEVGFRPKLGCLADRLLLLGAQ